MPTQSTSGPSDYLAAERTFLAWIRTGLALMGFGFVVARFGLFLEALGGGQSPHQTQTYGLSFWFGTGLILLGVAVNVFSALHHVRLVHQLERGEPAVHRPSTLAIAVAAILALLGLAMAVYLITVRDPPIDPQNKAQNNKEQSMTPQFMTPPSNGIKTIPSHYSVDETVKRVEDILAAKGVRLFAMIDHSGEAERVGLQMRPTKLLIFGNPKAGTPWMVAAPSLAIDLPLKILIAEDAGGTVSISWNDPAYLQERHRLPDEIAGALRGAGVEMLAGKAAAEGA